MSAAVARDAGAEWVEPGLADALVAVPLAPLDARGEAMLAAVVASLEAQVAPLADEACERVHAQVPEYAALSSRRGQLDLGESIRRVAGLGVRVLRDGGGASAEEIVLLHAVGAARADQGLPLEAMLAGLRLGVWLGWNEILGRVREQPLADASIAVLGTLALRLFGFADEAAAALAAGHAANRQRGRRRDDDRAELFDRLLRGAAGADDDLIREAAGQGHDLTAPHGLLLVTGHDRLLVRAAAAALRRRLAGAVVIDTHAGRPSGHVAVVVPSRDAAMWDEAVVAAAALAVERELTVVAVAPVCRPSRIAAAYREAAEGAPLAAAMFHRPRLVGSDDLLALRALRGRPQDRRRFVERSLGALLVLPPRHAEPLLDTLETLFEHGGNVEATRRSLGVHDKTIRYRIRRIREVTGLCPLRDRGRLELALMLHRLDGVDG